MALLLVAEGEARRVVPLPTLCLAGRGPGCLVRIPHAACPAHWLELRWLGSGWAWRVLSGAERTRATGAFLADGWRAMEVGTERGTRVSLGGEVWVELLDASPPSTFAWDLLEDRPVMGEELERVAEVYPDRLLPIAAEGDPSQALTDGACWLHREGDHVRALRAHLPTAFAATPSGSIDLERGGLHVEVDLARGIATLRQGASHVEVSGNCVRLFAIYGQARSVNQGWLTAAAAWAAWSELGGAESSPQEVVAWERARLRARLERARVGNVRHLFVVRKHAVYFEVRLADVIVEVLEVG